MMLNNQNWRMTNDNEIIKKHCEEVRKLLSQSYWAKDRTIEVIEKSIEQSLCFAIFDVETDNVEAIALYNRIGYKVIGHLLEMHWDV